MLMKRKTLAEANSIRRNQAGPEPSQRGSISCSQFSKKAFCLFCDSFLLPTRDYLVWRRVIWKMDSKQATSHIPSPHSTTPRYSPSKHTNPPLSSLSLYWREGNNQTLKQVENWNFKINQNVFIQNKIVLIVKSYRKSMKLYQKYNFKTYYVIGRGSSIVNRWQLCLGSDKTSFLEFMELIVYALKYILISFSLWSKYRYCHLF